jgi:hypothetical protein
MKTKSQTKADREKIIFLEFASVSGLAVDTQSVKSETPPLPDISCTIQGCVNYFELVEITDTDVAQGLSKWLKTDQVIGGALSQTEPLFYAFQSKSKKHCR